MHTNNYEHIVDDMTGELGEILIIFIKPDEGLYADLNKPALMSHHSRVKSHKISVIMKPRKPLG